ncbi:MAG TPA: carboxypeptidase-like regulatory domain-containing protein [Puia sp.]|nr:carboxypeptidase-like regulatory domain-containing protein [Puia sp.]
MKRIFGWLGLLLVAGAMSPLSGLAQTIHGTVRDSMGRAVPFVSLNLSRQGAIIAFTTTDTGGAYVLRLPGGLAPGGLYLEARCIGYNQQTRAVVTLPSTIDFVLGVSASSLPSVVVRNNRPVLRTSGDTLSYRVGDFSSAQDRVIGDVIKRLPGISVASDGTILYNNKPISSVYISGDNLLDDKYTIATNSIPQDIVDQIQVIDNHQPIKVLQNKVTSNDVALNLTMKKTGRIHLLGQESIGAGLPGNYDVNLNALLFKDEYKAINYLKGNNTGDDLQRELVSHNAADNEQRIGNELPATLLSLGAVNDPALSRQRYFFNHAGMLNANNLVNLKSGWQLRLNAWYLHDRQQQDYSQQTTTFLPGDTIQYREVQHNQRNPDVLHTQLTFNLNKPTCYFNDVLLMDDNRGVNYSHLNTNGSLLEQVFRDHSMSLSNECNWIGTVRAKNIIQAYSYISRWAEPEDRTIGPSYNAELFNHGMSYMQLVQHVDVPTWYMNNYVSFKIPGDVLTKSFRAGVSVQSQRLGSGLSLLQSDKTFTPASDSSVNKLSWVRKKGYAEAAFDVPGEKLRLSLSLPLIFQQLSYTDTGYALDKGLSRWYFNPQLSGKYQTGLEHFVSFQYSYRNETGGIEDVYQGYILKDYRTLYANNADLTLRQDHRAALGYNYRQALRLFFFSITMLYHHVVANNIASSVITNSLQQRVVMPYRNSMDSRTINGFVSKYSFRLHTTFSGDVQWQNSREVEIQNGALLPFTTTAITLGLNADTKLNDRIGFGYHATGIRTDSHSPAVASADRIDQLVQQAALYYNPTHDLQFNLSGEHYFTGRGGNAPLTYFFADARVKYHVKKWRMDWQLDALNFLNVRTYDALYLTTNTLTSSSYTLPGRIILVKLLFNL